MVGDKKNSFAFPKDICQKLNVIERPLFELFYYNITVQLIRHNHTTKALILSFLTNIKIFARFKIAPKEYTRRHDWVGKVIQWELCKKLKFDHANKGKYTTESLSKKKKRRNSSGILEYKRITLSQPEDQK